MSSFLNKKSTFYSHFKISKLLIKLKKKNCSTQPLRTRLIKTNIQYRLIEKPFLNKGIPGFVYNYVYDPYRSSNLLLIIFKNNTCSYYLNVESININDVLLCSSNSNNLIFFKKGNSSVLWNIPTTFLINQIEIDSKITYSKSSGCYSILLRKDATLNTAIIKLSSGIFKKVSLTSFAVIGIIGNTSFNKKTIWKAGQNRWLGKRPIVRGVAKNPVDHPHGGGEGKKSKNVFPKTFWGKQLKWRKTANKNRHLN